MLIETAIGSASGGMLLALLWRQGHRALTEGGYLLLVAMLTIYVGARLVSGSLYDIVIEAAIATLALAVTRWAMAKWPPAIGAAILLHGLYDAFLGAATGVASWYPALCAGFDIIVGAGLFALLIRRA